MGPYCCPAAVLKTTIRPIAEPGPRCSHCGAFAVQVKASKHVKVHDNSGLVGASIESNTQTMCGICELLQEHCTCLPLV